VRHLGYLAVLAGCLLGTAPLEFFLRTRVYARWRRLLATLVPVLAVFVSWDLYAVSRHQWTFDARSVTGIRLPGGLPIEEVLFFVVVPICAVLTLEAVRARRPGWMLGDERPADQRPGRQRLRDERVGERPATGRRPAAGGTSEPR
jgi:lycopene cyclase domain-containing protein